MNAMTEALKPLRTQLLQKELDRGAAWKAHQASKKN